jgi:ABC-2 type transport system permease protein
MISLEGKSFSILKSLPLKPFKIIQSKVLTALTIMLPCILIGDLVIFIKFKFDLLSIIIVLYASVLLPLIAETLGIIVNLKYPKMDGRNDTEIVKQSLSSTICVFAGMGIIGITIFLLIKAIFANFSNLAIMLSFTGIYTVIYLALLFLLHKTSEKSFDNIEV